MKGVVQSGLLYTYVHVTYDRAAYAYATSAHAYATYAHAFSVAAGSQPIAITGVNQ